MALDDLIAAQLARPAPPGVHALVREIVAAHGGSVLGVLFYGSCRRAFDPDGLLDFYVVYDRAARFHRRRLHAALNGALPPNVTVHVGGGQPVLRAKVATLSLRQFARAMRRGGIDTTMWARFTQPASLLYTRDAAAAAAIAGCIRAAVLTASSWAMRFAPPGADAAASWTALFGRTYGAELRPERANRPRLVYEADPAWFDAILPAALAEGVRANPGSWALRRVAGRGLNVLRLSKAASTFDNGADYIAWKLERHSGIRLRLSERQRRHPLLCAPGILLQMRALRRARDAEATEAGARTGSGAAG